LALRRLGMKRLIRRLGYGILFKSKEVSSATTLTRE